MHIVQLKRTTHMNVLHGSAQKYETDPLGDSFQEMAQPQVFRMKPGIFHKDCNHLLTGFYVPIKSKCFAWKFWLKLIQNQLQFQNCQES